AGNDVRRPVGGTLYLVVDEDRMRGARLEYRFLDDLERVGSTVLPDTLGERQRAGPFTAEPARIVRFTLGREIDERQQARRQTRRFNRRPHPGAAGFVERRGRAPLRLQQQL